MRLRKGFRRPPSPVTEQIADYCGNGARANQRILGNLRIIAVSDPNDILSYPVRNDFARTTLDSRLCTNLVNVSINVATEKDLFGATNFADPLTAHTGYLEDPRVVQLITEGVHEHDGKPPGNCRWQDYQNF